MVHVFIHGAEYNMRLVSTELLGDLKHKIIVIFNAEIFLSAGGKLFSLYKKTIEVFALAPHKHFVERNVRRVGIRLEVALLEAR